MIQVNMRQWTILTFIQWYCEEHGRAPSLSDIQSGCGVSRGPIHNAVASLVAAGAVERHSHCYPERIALAMKGQKVVVTP